MNDQILLMVRMLKTFPVKVLKDYFDISGKHQNDTINEIIETYSFEQIFEFVYTNFGYLRQHIHVFDLNKEITVKWTPCPNEFKKEEVFNNYKVYNLIFNASYKVINISTGEIDELIFHLPVQIWLNKLKFIVRINTLERNPNDYYEEKVIVTNKDLNEDLIINKIKNSLPQGITFVTCDLNKGIKALWEEDFIDCHSIRYRKPNSVSTEVMDEDDTLKNKYPELYKQIMLSPIDNNLFKILGENGDKIISHFKIEPTTGKLSFVKFPANTDSIADLLEIILSKN